MISRRQIIPGSAGPIFRNIYIEWKRFGCRWSICTSFFDISRDVAMATDFVKKMPNSPLSSLWHSETEWDIATTMCALTAQMMPYIVWKFREIRSSNFRVDRAYLWTSGMTWPKMGLFGLIYLDLRYWFLQSLHHMKAHYVQMMDL